MVSERSSRFRSSAICDGIGRREILPGTREFELISDEVGQPAQATFPLRLENSGCFVDDARLVVLNAVDAAERGAVIRPYALRAR